MLINPKSEEVNASLDLTPMIDMVFNLLIFFLVATTFHQTEREMKIALPVATADLPVTMLMREIVLNVDASGNVIVGGKATSLDEVDALITDAIAQNPEQKVTIRGDRAVPYGHLVRILDICKSKGVQVPYLDTVVR